MFKRLTIGLLALCPLAWAPPVENPLVKLSQEFAEATRVFSEEYSKWVILKNQEFSTPGTVSFASHKQWDQVKPSFSQVQKAFREMDVVIHNE